MRAVSERFREALTQSHLLHTRCDVLDASGKTVATLQPVGGEVKVDEKAKIRRSCSVQFAVGTTAELKELKELVGRRSFNELRLWRGIRYSTTPEDYETCVLGTFPIVDHKIVDTGADFTMTVNGNDRVWKAQRAKFKDFYLHRGTHLVSDFVRDILARQVPSLPTQLDRTDVNTTNMTFDVGADPWEKCASIVHAVGYELYVNAAGIARLRARRSYLSGVVVKVAEGGLLLDANLEEDSENQWNIVVVAGELPGAPPVRGYAEDDDPTSTTYVRGPMGEVPLFFKSRRIGSTKIANRVARALLHWATGWVERINFSSVVLPHLDEYDRLHFMRERLDINAVFNLEEFTIPLTADRHMTGAAVRRRLS